MPIPGKECRLCQSAELSEIIDLGQMPIAHRFPQTPDEKEEFFPFPLHGCTSCGLIQIVDPIDPETLYRHYNHNFSSWKVEPHIGDEIDAICAHGLPERVIDIGCNDGRFLDEIRNRGVKTCLGVEPNPVSGGLARDKGHRVFEAMLTPGLCREIVGNYGQVDAVVSRQVFEHLLDIGNFFACVDILLKPSGTLFLDLPDFEPALALGDVSYLWEEHVSYFTEPVLLNALSYYGYDVDLVQKYGFSGGTVAVRAKRSDAPRPSQVGKIDLTRQFENFAKTSYAYRAKLKDVLSHARKTGWQVALYGTGARANSVVNGLGLGTYIDFALDDQVERQGLYMPGSKLEIRPSERLADGKEPLVCLLAVNNESEEKVCAKVRRLANRTTAFATLFCPANIHEALEMLADAVGATE